MAPSHSWFPVLVLWSAAAAQAPNVPAEVVLAGDVDPLPVAAFGLGDGGIPPGARGELRSHAGGSTTPGGVRIDCREAGVKLTFPSGRELLLAADGHLHLRGGEVGGPFPTGVELRLADGAWVRVLLAPSSRQRLRQVVVGHGERVLLPWSGGGPADDVGRTGGWAGARLVCCGDGGDLYRVVALGPLLVLDRELVAAERAAQAPRERLVVATAPLVASLATMQRQHREPDAAVRTAIGAIAVVAERADAIFPAGAALRRVERQRLRWRLPAGFELQLDLDGPLAPRMSLHVGDRALPLVEWTLRADSAAYLTNPRVDQAGRRWHGNGTRLPRVATELQARVDRFEREQALRVVARLRR